ncbi:MAG TPA: ABC transporter permease [Candidatus Corynebacterium avicola]|uniref:Transport permease protein n=1 Tax=Candidatus Corynebacterium avicola TaxID=2838527 RepID=A0A9D1RPW4_9CORY|nr:ABC transporter permease [Candidatus Corynebacterium avicola]
MSTSSTVFVYAGRNIRGWSRTPSILVNSLIMPIGMLLTTVFMFGNAIEMATGSAPVQGLTPLMICTGPMFAGIASASGLVTERTTGIFTRFRTFPGPVNAPIIGRIAAETARGTVGAVLILAVGFLIGYRLDVDSVAAGVLSVVGIIAVAALVSLAFSSMLTWVGLVMRTPEATVAAMPVMMILLFMNEGFMPAEGFPSALRSLVELNPLSAAVEAMNACAGHGGSVWPALVWLVGVTVVGLTLVTVQTRRGWSRP